MKTTAVVGWCLAMIFGFLGTATWLDKKLAAEAATARESILQAKYAEAVLESERVADTVVREVTKTRTLRDSVLLHLTDTVAIQEFVYRVDTLVIACERCANQLRALRVASDSIIAAKDGVIVSLRPSRFQKALPYVAFGAGLYLGLKATR